jgi:hypothetical protein
VRLADYGEIHVVLWSSPVPTALADARGKSYTVGLCLSSYNIMKSPVRSPQPQFFSYLWASTGALLLVTVAFMFYVWTEKRIDQANELRYASHNLVEELRQSSDDLSRMARTYVATGDEQYRRHYEKILAIREGRAPRPHSYENVYWDLVLDNGQRPRASGAAASLMQLMREAQLAPEELALLAAARAIWWKRLRSTPTLPA